MIGKIILIIIGFIILIKGADLLVKSATSIAKKFGISELLIGLTIVAVGTSLPEIFITITSATNGHSDLIIGNAIGSCICNFLLVIGITSLVKPIKIEKRIIKIHCAIVIATLLLLLALGNIDIIQNMQTITRWQGIVLILCAITYILYTIYEEKRAKNKTLDKEIIEDVEAKELNSTSKIIIYIILGIIGLKFGSDFVVDNAIIIAQQLGISQKIIGMTIVAIGTSLPEIITGIVTARKNETDLLLGNVFGSNILNLLLLIGLGAIINPLKFETNINYNLVSLILITVILQLITTINKKNEIDRKRGFFLILIYSSIFMFF